MKLFDNEADTETRDEAGKIREEIFTMIHQNHKNIRLSFLLYVFLMAQTDVVTSIADRDEKRSIGLAEDVGKQFVDMVKHVFVDGKI